MIQPTVGRMVLFHPAGDFTGRPAGQGAPLPAFICLVLSPAFVNIGGFDAEGIPFSAPNCRLIQGDEPIPVGTRYATLMPLLLDVPLEAALMPPIGVVSPIRSDLG